MSQGRISYSRIGFVCAIFFGIAYGGFSVGRGLEPAKQLRVDDVSQKGLNKVPASPNTYSLALLNLVTVVPTSTVRMSGATGLRAVAVLNAEKREPSDVDNIVSRLRLALSNLRTIVVNIEKPLPVSTMSKADFAPVDIGIERQRLALRNALTIIPSLKNHDRISFVEKTDTSNGVSDIGSGIYAQGDKSWTSFPRLISPRLPPFISPAEGLWSKFGQPVWYVRPGDYGLVIGEVDLESETNVPTFFGGLTEREFRTREARCLAKAIYHEARGESQKGQFAVAQTIMNRVRAKFFPDTICGVIYENSHKKNRCQFSFACDGISDKPKDLKLWKVAQGNARQVVEGKVWLDDIGYASHYHATYVRPNWRKYMNRIKRIGIHIFYRAKFLPLPEELALRSPKKSKSAN